ncbi:uncharacterized protein LOC107477058 [Arachis duranensis]|uniref:Uncharacterized protein LOC107477058 n=2 Tax=Arachis TaxID=3817 RepID=A0A9C6TVN4_ARADU|nr:uncharacterized protein LOC107477058 [Arachis duranensis]
MDFFDGKSFQYPPLSIILAGNNEFIFSKVKDMAIFNNGLAYTIVIVVLISPEITTQVVSPPPDSPPGNVSEPIRPKDNTVRVDPYDNFKKYRGGFNITNKHYWSSVVFTGVYGYAIGVLWLLCGILCGLFFLIINCCCQSFGGNKGCDLLPIPLAILLLIIAMAASGLVLAGSAKFRCHASSSVNVVINTADKASGIIFNITGALKGIPTELVDADIASKLNTTSQRFDTAAQNITQEAAKNRHIIIMALKALFSDDTCNALYNFQENPYNNSLSSMIPCDELLSAKPIVSEFSSGIYNLVNEVNGGLSKYQGALLPNLPNICNPFSAPPDFLYQPWNCSPNSTKIGDIPEVLRPYTCFGDEDAICGKEKFIPGSEYEVIKEYTSSVQNLLDVYPSIESLLGCQLVKDAFSQVLQKHCKPLKRFSKVTWAAMVSLAATMVLLVVLWTMKANYHEHSHQP